MTRLPHSTIRLAPLARQWGHVCRWIWLALPEDAQQEAALAIYQHPTLTPLAMEHVIRHRLHILRHEVWDRQVGRIPRTPPSIRPSKLARMTGYKRDSARKREVRMKLTPERRREIAAMGAAA